MTTYKFPTALGGGEYDSVSDHGDTVGFDLPGVSKRLWIPVTDLTPVMDEPPVRCVVQLTHRDGTADVFARDADGWWQTGSSHSTRWAAIRALGGELELLVPAAGRQS